MSRPWDALERANREHWRGQSSATRFRIAQELYDAARARGDWPTAGQRAADLAHHQRLSELLLRGSRECAWAGAWWPSRRSRWARTSFDSKASRV